MIVLIRHGETAGNAGRVVQTEDTPLNARGIEQARQLARRLATHPIAYVLCSDLPRARMTAEPLVVSTGAQIEYTALLRERSFGALRGRPYAELDADIFAPDYVPPDGESIAEFQERVERAWDRIRELSAHVQGDLAVVTHGLLCAALVERFLKRDLGHDMPARWSNTSVTLFDAQAPYRVSLLNCVAHLGEGLGDGLGTKV
jgi:probable phosphoglycerate mutase